MTIQSILVDYYRFINDFLFIVAVIFFISAVEDCFVDICYWSRRFYQFVLRKKYNNFKLEDLEAEPEKDIAIMVPAWQEDSVIAQMLETNIKFINYKKYHFFVGVYENDPATNMEVDIVATKRHNVHKVVVPHAGPTCKADCLNWIIQSIFLYEKKQNIDFDMIAMHDAEDVIHPLELKLFNYVILKKDFIQIPVRALENAKSNMISGIYMDEFAEYHNKDMLVREALCGIIPSAGVASCFSKKAIKTLSLDNDGQVFNTDSLTEDYDISYRLSRYNVKQIFATFAVDVTYAKNIFQKQFKRKKTLPIAVAEFFPDTIKGAIKQRTRWNIGIFFQSAGKLTWEGGFFTKYWFLRDRKGLFVNIMMFPAYFLTLNIMLLWIAHKVFNFPLFEMNIPYWLVMANLVFFINRILQRMYFTSYTYGLIQGILSFPRIIVANIINFVATTRAAWIFTKAKILHQTIAWDKTAHHYPSMDILEAQYKDIGDILFSKNKINEAQLKDALIQQSVTNKIIGSILLEAGLIDEEDLLNAICEQTKYPKAKYDLENISQSYKLLPSRIIREYRIFPIGINKENSRLQLVATEPIKYSALKEILNCGYKSIEPFAIINPQLDKLIETFLKD